MRKSKTLVILVTSVFTLATFIFWGCDKATISSTPTEDISYVAHHALLERTFSDIITIADQVAMNSASNMRTTNGTPLSSCVTFYLDTNTYRPLSVLTITFGTGGTNTCLCTDGKKRRGQILVSWNHHYADSNTAINIKFNNYYVDSNQINGKIDLTNIWKDANGNPRYTVAINASLTYPKDSGMVNFISNRIRTVSAGSGTYDYKDDAYTISTTDSAVGGATMTVTTGGGVVKSYTVKITTPLYLTMNCSWIEQGVVRFTIPHNNNDRILDYSVGTGNCDNQASIDVDHFIYTIGVN
jgi:hypothetical protein